MKKNTGKGRKKHAFPACNIHTDCFAHKDGKCVCLSENDFGKRDCSFYKPDTEADMDEIMAECKAYAETHGGSGKED